MDFISARLRFDGWIVEEHRARTPFSKQNFKRFLWILMTVEGK
jgi:hypothetical protein